MTDAQLALLVLVLLYLWECLLWLRRDAAGFLPTLSRDHRIVLGGGMYGSHRKAVILTNPIPFLGQAFVSQQWPVSLSPEGVYSYVAQAFNPGERPQQHEQFWRFERIKEIQIREDSVYINGELFVETQSSMLARRIAALIRQLSDAPAARRPGLIDTTLRELLDTAAVERRLAEFRAASSWLSTCCNVLFLHLLVICPIVAWQMGLTANWLILLATLLALMVLTVIAFWRGYRRLYPQKRSEAITHTVSVALFAPGAIRSTSVLARDALIEFHPLAVARVLCSPERFREFAGAMLRDLDHPIAPVCPDVRIEAQAVEAYFRERLKSVLEARIVSSDLDLVALREPPQPDDESCRAYCPRCHTQFLIDAGQCDACGGLALMPLPGDRSRGPEPQPFTFENRT